MLEKLTETDPDEAERFRAGLAQLVDSGNEEDTEADTDAMAPRGAQDSAARGWRAVARAAAPPLRADDARPSVSAEQVIVNSRIRPATSSVLRRFPAARRIRLMG